MAQNTPGKQLADLLVTRDYDPTMLDSSGKPAGSAEDAEIFSFDFVTSNGTNHGTVVVMLGADNELEVFSGDNVGRGMDSEDKTEWYEFQHQLKNFATKNFMTFSSQNINRLKYSMQGQAALKEGLFESWNGTKNISWNGNPDSVRLMIKHKRPLGVNEARFRQVESLFVETSEGERYKLPFRNLAGGRAMVEHVRQGGKPYDMRGTHITSMVEELNVLSRFKRASKTQVFEGDTANLVNEANVYYETVSRSLKGLSSSRGYNKYFESWNPAEVTGQDVIIEDLKTLFVQETIDSRIEQALPILARIQQQGNDMKEANIFEAWADGIVDGTTEEVAEQQEVNEGNVKKELFNKAENMSKQEFVADATAFGMPQDEAIDFWNNANGVDDEYNDSGLTFDDSEFEEPDLEEMKRHAGMEEGEHAYRPSGEEIAGKNPANMSVGDKMKQFIKTVADKVAPDDETLLKDLEKKTIGEAECSTCGMDPCNCDHTLDEASWINGKKQDDSELVWKQTSMSYEEACKKYGKENCKIGGKTGRGEDEILVKVPLVGETKQDDKEPKKDNEPARYDSGWKKSPDQHKDQFGNVIKDKNMAKHLAKHGMKSHMEEQVTEDTDAYSALSGQYGHSGKLQEFDKVEDDILSRLKQLSGLLRSM
jgi:hypothetical protein